MHQECRFALWVFLVGINSFQVWQIHSKIYLILWGKSSPGLVLIIYLKYLAVYFPAPQPLRFSSFGLSGGPRCFGKISGRRIWELFLLLAVVFFQQNDDICFNKQQIYSPLYPNQERLTFTRQQLNTYSLFTEIYWPVATWADRIVWFIVKDQRWRLWTDSTFSTAKILAFTAS